MADKLRFGTGGMPLTSKSRKALDGINRLSELGLEHLELEFVYQVFVKEEETAEIKLLAEEKDISLSVHGSYYVNLASPDNKKFYGSVARVKQAAERGDQVGARSVTYHSGFRQAADEESLFETVKKGTKAVLDDTNKMGLDICISPELTGKPSQYGDLEELIRLVKELREEGYGERIGFCFDFAHKYARSNGQFNSYDEFMQMLQQIADGLGNDFLQDMHIHVSGIEYSEKGERNHLLYLPTLAEYTAKGLQVDGIEKHFAGMPEKRLAPNQFDWKGLMEALHKADVKGYVVCESPILELDSLLMQQYYRSL